MANTPRNNDNEPTPDPARPPLPEWLSTDQWLGDDEAPLGETPPDRPAGSGVLDDAITIADVVEGPSGVQLGREQHDRPPFPPASSKVDSDRPSPVDFGGSQDSSGYLPLPESALIGRADLAAAMAELRAAGAISDPTIDLGTLPSDSSDALGGSAVNPTAPASGWLASSPKLPPPSATGATDIGGRTPRADDASDIFSSTQTMTGGSRLESGIAGQRPGGSNVFVDPSRGGNSGGESDLFAGLSADAGRGSSLYDDSARRTERVAPADDEDDEVSVFEIPPHSRSGPVSSVHLRSQDSSLHAAEGGPGSSLHPGIDDASHLDYDLTDRSPSGSNLFGDVTAMDIDLSSEIGASGLNLLDPDGRVVGQDSGIFHKTATEDISDPGRVDLSEIPLMGSTDERTQSMLLGDLAGPRSAVLRKEKELEHSLAEASVRHPRPDDDDAGKIEWGSAEMDRADQVSMRYIPMTDEIDLADPEPSDGDASFPGGRVRREPADTDSVFDDKPQLPNESGVLFRNTDTTLSPDVLAAMSRAQDSTPRVKARPKPSSDSDSSTGDLPRTGRGNRWMSIAGIAAVLGIGGGGALYYLKMQNDLASPLNTVAARNTVDASSATEAARILAAGDPTGALKLFDKIQDNSPVVAAGRGQARWMARVRDMATQKMTLKANDDDLALAKADLQKAVEAPAATPEEQSAVMRAGLHLGLIEEATGNAAAAEKIYTGMAEKFPSYQKVFDSAKRRVGLMKKGADGRNLPAAQYSLAPEAARDLAAAAIVLLQFPPVQAIDDEPGFHFWDAVGFAATHEYAKARGSIKSAKAAHAARRRTLVGMGLNPLSDPTEQMFLKACDELDSYWDLKRRMYDDPTVREMAAKEKDDAGKTLDQLIAAKKTGGGDPQAALAMKTMLDAAKAETEKAKTALDGAEKARLDVVKTLETEKVDAADKAAKLAVAMDAVAAATAKVKAADGVYDALIEKLKTAKLIDAKATREEAIAALPAAAKKAIVLGEGGSDMAELARQLADTRDTAKKEKDLADAKAKATETLIATLEAKAKAGEEKMATAITEATAAAKAETAATARKLEAKLAEQTEAHRVQLAAASTGTPVVQSDRERDAADRASRAYGTGVDAFFNKNYGNAETAFAQAVQFDGNDARYWYFLGLSKWQQGRTQEADGDFQKGAALEARGKPGRKSVGDVLARVQGSARAAVDAARP